MAFYQNVSPSKELRDASNEAESLVRDFGVESSMRLDVYQAKVAAEKNLKESGEWEKLSPEEKRLVDKMVRSSITDSIGMLRSRNLDLGWNPCWPCST